MFRSPLLVLTLLGAAACSNASDPLLTGAGSCAVPPCDGATTGTGRTGGTATGQPVGQPTGTPLGDGGVSGDAAIDGRTTLTVTA